MKRLIPKSRFSRRPTTVDSVKHRIKISGTDKTNIPLLSRCQNAWENLSDFRATRLRNFRYVFGDKIEVTNNAFKITLPNRNAVKATDSVPNERKSNEEKILDLIAQNDYVVRSDVDQLLDVSQTTASRILKRMVTDGLIYQDGSGRKTKYRKG